MGETCGLIDDQAESAILYLFETRKTLFYIFIDKNFFEFTSSVGSTSGGVGVRATGSAGGGGERVITSNKLKNASRLFDCVLA